VDVFKVWGRRNYDTFSYIKYSNQINFLHLYYDYDENTQQIFDFQKSSLLFTQNMKKASCLLIIDNSISHQPYFLAVSRKEDHNDFGIPGGKAEPDDNNLLMTAIRETYEETGINAFEQNLYFLHAGMDGEYLVTTFYTYHWSGQIVPEKNGGLVKWLPLSKLKESTCWKYYNTSVYHNYLHVLSKE